MPTIIDSLIIQLGIDPAGLTDGEKAAAESLRRLEANAQRAGDSIGTSTKRSMRNFLESFEEQFAKMSARLDEIAEHGAKAGEAVNRGARSGAYGLSELAAAGLSAYAALKAVSGVYSDFTRQVPAVAALGRIADLIHADPQRFWTVGHAAQATTGASADAVMGEIASMQTDIQRVRAGRGYSDNLIQIARYANIDPMSASWQQILTAIETASQNDPDALAKLQAMGFSASAAYLRRGPAAAREAEAQMSAYAPTDEQIRKMQQLQFTTNLLFESFEHLNRAMVEDLSGPLMDFENWLKGVTDAASKDADQRQALEVGLTATVANILYKGLQVVARAIGISLPGLGAAETVVGLPLMLGGDTPRPNEVGPGGWRDNSVVGWAFNWMTGNGFGPLHPRSSAESGSVLGVSGIVAAARAAGANDSAITAMFAGALGEGGLGPNPTPGDNGTSFGHWQLHRGGELDRYLREGNQIGDSTAETRYVLKRLNEIMPGFSQSTDRAAQIQAIKQFENSQQGNATGGEYYGRNWDRAQQILAATPGGTAATQQSRLPTMSSKFVFGTDTPPAGAGKPGFDWSGQESQKDLARVREELAATALIRSRSASGPGGTSIDRSTHVEINTGDIHGHANTPQDGYKVGGAIANSLHDQMMVNMANTGQQ